MCVIKNEQYMVRLKKINVFKIFKTVYLLFCFRYEWIWLRYNKLPFAKALYQRQMGWISFTVVGVKEDVLYGMLAIFETSAIAVAVRLL